MVAAITIAAVPQIVTASASHSCRRTRRLSEAIGPNPATTWRIGTACATPHTATTAAAAYASSALIATMICTARTRDQGRKSQLDRRSARMRRPARRDRPQQAAAKLNILQAVTTE